MEPRPGSRKNPELIIAPVLMTYTSNRPSSFFNLFPFSTAIQVGRLGGNLLQDKDCLKESEYAGSVYK